MNRFASLGATKKAWTVATSIAGPREVTLGDGANAEADVLGGAVPGLLHNSDHVAALLVQPPQFGPALTRLGY